MMFGQDRYRRRYWILPQCGGIFVEGMESGEGKTQNDVIAACAMARHAASP